MKRPKTRVNILNILINNFFKTIIRKTNNNKSHT